MLRADVFHNFDILQFKKKKKLFPIIHQCTFAVSLVPPARRGNANRRDDGNVSNVLRCSAMNHQTQVFRRKKSIGAFEWRWRRYQVMTLRWVRRRPVVGGRNGQTLLQGQFYQDTELFQLDRDSFYPQTHIYRCWTCSITNHRGLKVRQIKKKKELADFLKLVSQGENEKLNCFSSLSTPGLRVRVRRNNLRQWGWQRSKPEEERNRWWEWKKNHTSCKN